MHTKLSDFALYPCKDIGIYLVLVDLVEHLMSAALVELYADILHTSLTEVFVSDFYALTALADGVHGAGHEVNRDSPEVLAETLKMFFES